MAQIEYKNITKDYDVDDRVLDNVSFKVEKGEFVFLVGPSGAGKTTLIKLLIREELPTEGEIWFEGLGAVEDAEAVESIASDVETVSSLVNIFDLPHDRLPELRRRIGVVFQDFKVLNSKNVFENVAVALEVAGATLNEIKNIVPNVLGLVGLSDKAEHFPKQLSGGEIQRLSIARALAHEPEILVADEPTGMIDRKATDDVLQVLERINSLGTTIIMATHDYKIVDKMKKRVLRLEKGKLTSDKKEGKYDE
ncbi:hypothetical protein A2886_03450 [candidate division WWE3 bacterium RIFCSPHIGHO2_01_FULL_42_13]|uniref:ABC transporter domain-containing protein n=1 Tax=candidate division WWE3 bacterium RIFCSPHIGHO2_01_FULL_42_13 TaxID=1802617 RepID=A0A1F4UTB9_UNCKA|nr:MAG: hypothetical protein A2886_03450 [candidate division WWE3 bacterium RIFCSPHIGHO2_01_FULL_42_13]